MKRLLIVLVSSLTMLAACGSASQPIEVSQAWARTTVTGQTNGAIYFDIAAAADDTLVAASVPDSVAARAEIHEVVPADTTDGEEGGSMDQMGDEVGSNDMEMSDTSVPDGMDMGAMTMRQLTDGLALPAGETISFEPGSFHVMLVDLVEPLTTGVRVPLTLSFAEADDITITVDVSETGP